MAEFSMEHIYKQLAKQPGLPEAIEMEAAMRFVHLAVSLKRTILHQQKPGYKEDAAPARLPDCVHAFLASSLGLCDEYVQGCWDAFKTTIWQFNPDLHSSAADAKLFYEHGKKHNLGQFPKPDK